MTISVLCHTYRAIHCRKRWKFNQIRWKSDLSQEERNSYCTRQYFLSSLRPLRKRTAYYGQQGTIVTEGQIVPSSNVQNSPCLSGAPRISALTTPKRSRCVEFVMICMMLTGSWRVRCLGLHDAGASIRCGNTALFYAASTQRV